VDRLRRVLGWWSVRPALTAAAVYALLAVLMVGQGLLPGRTLSGADGLLSSDPWLSSKPADVPGLRTRMFLARGDPTLSTPTRSRLSGVAGSLNPWIQEKRTQWTESGQPLGPCDAEVEGANPASASPRAIVNASFLLLERMLPPP